MIVKKINEIKSSKINNIKIALLSDIHYSKEITIKFLDELYLELKNGKPNYICIAGDLLDESKNADNIIFNWLEKLSSLCPLLICIGNHDVLNKKRFKEEYAPNNSFFFKLNQRKNIYVLDNRSIKLNGILFHGYKEKWNFCRGRVIYSFDNFQKNLNIKKYQIDTSSYNILITHSPESIIKSPKKVINNDFVNNMDLILCGHMHNGMVPTKIKGNRGMVGPHKKLFPSFARGIYKFNNTNILVSGGITKVSNIAPLGLKKINNWYAHEITYIIIDK